MILPGVKRSLRSMIVPVLGAATVVYFGYHAVQGQHGLFARGELVDQIADAEATLAKVKAEREELEHRTALLDPAHVDLDMLDEQSRRMLNYAAPNEIVLFLDDGETAASP
jgi:cell division protein FtsB